MKGEATGDEDVPEASSSTRLVETESPVIKEEADGDIDPAMADWFKIDKTSPQGEDAKYDDDSVTDEDSDNADVAEDADGEREEDDLDEWFGVKKQAAKPEAFEASGSMVKFLFFIHASFFPSSLVSLRRVMSRSRWGKARLPWNTTKSSFSNICSSTSNILCMFCY
jgi:hypothetical protein